MLSAPDAPAPTAIASSEAKPSTGCIGPGASIMPTSAVNTTSDITRGFSSAKIIARLRRARRATAVRRHAVRATESSSSVASPVWRRPRLQRAVRWSRPREAVDPARCSKEGSGGRGRRSLNRQWSEPVMRGSVSNWWNGGGEDSVHSSVVAPSPHGLSPARRFLRGRPRRRRRRRRATPSAEDVGAEGRDLVPAREGVRIVDVAARHAGEAEEVLREERQVHADERRSRSAACRASRCTCSRSSSGTSSTSPRRCANTAPSDST